VRRVLTSLCLAAAAWFGTAVPAAGPPDEAGQALPELRPGARGTVLTTLEGRTPQEIPVTYLGIYRNFAGPGRDLHLVEMTGPVAERVGAADGMSGSPVFFDGRLLGALAYRIGALPKEAIAGVTPIADILDASRAATAVAGGAGAAVRPIGTPVFLGGLARPAYEWLAPRLGELGFVAVTGGGASGGELAGASLAPGAPVAVEWVRGDLRMAASGTVTLIDDDVVYAFGHSMFGSGRVEMPMAPAEVIHTVADLAGSYHLVEVGPSVGAVLEDRQSAIVGRIGHEARMIPMELRVRGGDYREHVAHFEIVAKSELTPLLAGVAAANALLLSNGYTERSTVMARGLVRLRDLPDLPLEMAFAGSQGLDPGVAVAGSLFGLLRGLWDNPFAEVEVERVELELEVRLEPVSYRVESLHYDRGSLRPGQPLQVRCVLREHRGGLVTHDLAVRLPEQLPRRGTLTLAVGSPAGIDGVLGNLLARRLQTARNLEAVIDALVDQRSAHRLTAVVYQPGGAAVSRGIAYSELPPTAERLLTLGPSRPDAARRRLVSPLGRAEVELDGPVEGGLQIRLKIDRGHATEEDR